MLVDPRRGKTIHPLLTNQIFTHGFESCLELLGSSFLLRAKIDRSKYPSHRSLDPIRLRKALSYLDEMQKDRLVPSEVLGSLEKSRYPALGGKGGEELNLPGREVPKSMVINHAKWDDPPTNHPSFTVHTTYTKLWSSSSLYIYIYTCIFETFGSQASQYIR